MCPSLSARVLDWIVGDCTPVKKSVFTVCFIQRMQRSPRAIVSIGFKVWISIVATMICVITVLSASNNQTADEVARVISLAHPFTIMFSIAVYRAHWRNVHHGWVVPPRRRSNSDLQKLVRKLGSPIFILARKVEGVWDWFVWKIHVTIRSFDEPFPSVLITIIVIPIIYFGMALVPMVRHLLYASLNLESRPFETRFSLSVTLSTLGACYFIVACSNMLSPTAIVASGFFIVTFAYTVAICSYIGLVVHPIINFPVAAVCIWFFCLVYRSSRSRPHHSVGDIQAT